MLALPVDHTLGSMALSGSFLDLKVYDCRKPGVGEGQAAIEDTDSGILWGKISHQSGSVLLAEPLWCS